MRLFRLRKNASVKGHFAPQERWKLRMVGMVLLGEPAPYGAS